MKIAMVGSRGIPARYGGSQTVIEEIGERLMSPYQDLTEESAR